MPKSLVRHLWRCFRLKLLGFAIFAAYCIPFGFATPTPVIPDLPHPSPAEIIAGQHDCWVNEAPADMAGKMPGAMVTTDAHYVTDSKRVSVALENILSGKNANVYAFCRGGSL